MSHEERQILSGEKGRCSSCGQPIEDTEAEVILRHPNHPGDDLYFHEAEECSEPALQLADAYPDEWIAMMRVPTHWGSGLIDPRYPEEAN
jgi:hypothetical protein